MKSYIVKIKIIELEPESYHIITRIKVENRFLHFIIDTGATHTCMDKDSFIYLYPQEPILAYEGDSAGIASNGFKTEVTTFRNFKIGRMVIPEQKIILLDLKNINQIYEMLGKPKIEGIIGGDFLVKYNAIIDFKAKEMKLWKNS